MKKTVITLSIATLLLTACSSSTSNFTSTEQDLYNIQKNNGQKALKVSTTLENELKNNTNPDYTKISEITKETSKYIKNSLIELDKLEIGEDTAPLATSTKVVLESTKRIIDKAREFADEGKKILSDNKVAEDEEESLNQLTKSLNGFKLRLEKSKEKLDNLSTQLEEIAETRNK